MKNTMKIIFVSSIFSSVLWAQGTKSESPNEIIPPLSLEELCPEQLKAFENIQISQSLSNDGKRCYLSIHPRDAFQTLKYRDYLLTSDGFLMVFNSYSAQLDRVASDGARDFYFFTKEFKGFSWFLEGEHLVVIGFATGPLQFSLKNAQVIMVSGAEIKVANEVSPVNRGGFEILSSNFTYIDSGFLTGGSPSSNKSGKSEVKNPWAQTCALKNSKLFNYVKDEAYLKSEEEIQKIVKASCSGFTP
jgi:hypothetical protein